MRRLCLILLCGLIAVPAALAAVGSTGDGVLELQNVNGVVVVTGSRGTLWGQMDKGKLVVTDPNLNDGQIFVSGADHTIVRDENVTVYSGADIHFRVTGGKYRLAFVGSGIDLTAVGVGTAQLSGDLLADDPGVFAIDSGKAIPVPYSPAKRFVQFGVQATTVGGPSQTP